MKKIVFALTALIWLSLSFSASAQYYVQSGDTMAKIAQRNGVSLKELISLNPHHKNPNMIHIGDYIITPQPVEKKKVLVEYARSLQDVTKYVYGGQNAPLETDCSGWVQYIYGKFGLKIPRTSREQAIHAYATPVKFQDLQVGDLMFFSTRKDKVITHTGIYMGNDFWISNLNEKKDVEVLSTFGSWTQDYFLWGTRYKL